jgi:Beta-lactamase enzyme family
VPVALPPPVLVTPSPSEVSFGRVSGRIPRGTQRLVVTLDGRVVAEKEVHPARRTFDFHVALPQRDVRLTVTAVADGSRRASATVAPVFGLPRGGSPRAPPRRSSEDAALAREINSLGRGFPGICGIFVQDLRSGGGAAWNARAEFPAASTLKVGIAIEVLRALRGKPQRGSRIDRLLRKAIVPSDDKAANELLTWLGGSTSAGANRVNGLFRALGLRNTDMYGGYIVESSKSIPLRSIAQPTFVGKRTTAWDFARLLRDVHLSAEGRGPLARLGGFVPSEARFLMYLLAHAQPNWLARGLGGQRASALHKPGWITRARHDGGVVYWQSGAFVAVVLTWNARGVGASSEVLAGRVARAALRRFKARSGRRRQMQRHAVQPGPGIQGLDRRTDRGRPSEVSWLQTARSAGSRGQAPGPRRQRTTGAAWVRCGGSDRPGGACPGAWPQDLVLRDDAPSTGTRLAGRVPDAAPVRRSTARYTRRSARARSSARPGVRAVRGS